MTRKTFGQHFKGRVTGCESVDPPTFSYSIVEVANVQDFRPSVRENPSVGAGVRPIEGSDGWLVLVGRLICPTAVSTSSARG